MRYKSLEDFLSRWHNAPETVEAINIRHSLEEANAIANQPVDRNTLRYYRRHLLSVLSAFDLDVALFKNPETGHFLLNVEAVEDLFTNILNLQKNEVEFRAICQKKFELVPEKTLAHFLLQTYDALTAIGYSFEQVNVQLSKFGIRTGCQSFNAYLCKRSNVTLEAARQAALSLQTKDEYIKYYFSDNMPPHHPFSDTEWDNILNEMEHDYTHIKHLFIDKWVAKIKQMAQTYPATER